MQAPAKPASEGLRLQTLQNLQVLDTPAEERFDRITRVASKMFQVPIALVSLVDENRQWFKSCVGLSASETPRDISFCGHAILGDEMFHIHDASQDPRFADNPLVTGPPNIRFYAGQPLTAPNGEKMGTLCLIDSKPRQMDKDDVYALQSLASMVEGELAALHLATIDDLTGLCNRRGFEQLAQQSLNFSLRHQFPITCAYLDLDQFKPINDQYGHAEGDRALKIFANQLQENIRDSDIPARLGGDEFVVLFNHCDAATASTTLQRFEKDIINAQQKHQLAYELKFSYGIVQYDSETHQNLDELIQQADRKMYQSKKR